MINSESEEVGVKAKKESLTGTCTTLPAYEPFDVISPGTRDCGVVHVLPTLT